jgi:hypothetical protein
MAVTVKENPAAGEPGVGTQPQPTVVDRLGQRLLDLAYPSRDVLRPRVVGQQGDALVAQGEQAGRLAPHDGRFRFGAKQGDEPGGLVPRVVEQMWKLRFTSRKPGT